MSCFRRDCGLACGIVQYALKLLGGMWHIHESIEAGSLIELVTASNSQLRLASWTAADTYFGARMLNSRAPGILCCITPAFMNYRLNPPMRPHRA